MRMNDMNAYLEKHGLQVKRTYIGNSKYEFKIIGLNQYRMYIFNYPVGHPKPYLAQEKFLDGVLNDFRVKPMYAMLNGDPVKESEQETEEWIWVTGYKGTDKDMKCRDYQFEMGVKHDMPEDAEIVECRGGFHLCPELNQVFNYYYIQKGNRFFKVSALVRKKDWDKYQEQSVHYLRSCAVDKLVAKSIIFLSECTPDEILTAKNIDISDWTEEDKKEAITTNPNAIVDKCRFQHLKASGYSEAFSHYLAYRCGKDFYERAMAIAAEDVSMDVKVLFIMDED